MFEIFPLNLGIRAHDLTSTTKETLVQKLKEFRLTHIQFAPQKAFQNQLDLTKMTLGTASHFGRYFQKNDIELSILGCYVNISSEDSTVRKQALTTFNHQISLCSAYGARMIATETGSVGTGYTKKNFTEEAYRVARSSVIEMVKEAEKFGVTVAIEAGINHPLHSYQLAKRLIHEVASPNLKLILDCANLIHPQNHSEQELLVRNALEELGPYLVALHLKDYLMKNNTVQIVPVGQGCLDFRPLMHFIKKERPFLYATLEATPEMAVSAAIEHLDHLYQTC